MAYICIRIKSADGRNPFYTQTSVTKESKKFELYKFREISVCKFLRKTRFGKIPQMINVLKGDMSIIGIKVVSSFENEIYKKEIPYFSTRYVVNAGWASYENTIPRENEKYTKENLQYDLYFIKNRNISHETKILIKALFFV